MFGKDSDLNPLESRKRLLIAESELNRTRLVTDMTALAGDARALVDRANSFVPIASSAAALVAGLSALQRGQAAVNGNGKPSWLPGILRSVGLVSTVWLAFRSRIQRSKEN